MRNTATNATKTKRTVKAAPIKMSTTKARVGGRRSKFEVMVSGLKIDQKWKDKLLNVYANAISFNH